MDGKKEIETVLDLSSDDLSLKRVEFSTSKAQKMGFTLKVHIICICIKSITGQSFELFI